MNVAELVTVLAFIVVGTLTTATIYLGLLGMLGAVYLVRCASYNHWTLASARGQLSSCPRCHQPVLAVHAVRQPGQIDLGGPMQKLDRP